MPHKILPILLMSTIVLQLEAQSITNYTTADGLVSDFVECIDIDMNGGDAKQRWPYFIKKLYRLISNLGYLSVNGINGI